MASTRKVTWPFDKVVLQGHMKHQKHISTIRVPFAAKVDSIVIYLEGLLPIKVKMTLWSHGLTRSCGKLKPLYLHYRNAYG